MAGNYQQFVYSHNPIKYVCERCPTPYERRNEDIGCKVWLGCGHRWIWISMRECPGTTPSPEWANDNDKCATRSCSLRSVWYLNSTRLSYCLECYLRNREIHGLNSPRFTGFDDVEMKESKYKVGQVVAILTHNPDRIGWKTYAAPNYRVDSGKFDKIVQIYSSGCETWLRFLTYTDLPEVWVRPLNPSEMP